jgi:hypothetical protein
MAALQSSFSGLGNGPLPRLQSLAAEVGAPAAVFVPHILQTSHTANMRKFVEYDQRAHKLETLANFAFWVQSKLDILQDD